MPALWTKTSIAIQSQVYLSRLTQNIKLSIESLLYLNTKLSPCYTLDTKEAKQITKDDKRSQK